MLRTRRVIDDEGAATAIAAAERYANSHGHRVVIAVVDPSGELIQLSRTAGAQIASSRVAVDKARTAAIFVRPSPRNRGAGDRTGASARSRCTAPPP